MYSYISYREICRLVSPASARPQGKLWNMQNLTVLSKGWYRAVGKSQDITPAWESTV